MDQFMTSMPTPYFFETGGGMVFCVNNGIVYRWSGDEFKQVNFVNNPPAQG